MRKRLKIGIGSVLGTAFIFFCLFLTGSMLFVFYTWPEADIREIVFHMQAPLQGADGSFYTRYLLFCVLPAVILTGMWLWVHSLFRKFMEDAGNLEREDEYKVYIKYKLWMYGTMTVLFLLALGILLYGWKRLQVGEYLKNQSSYSGFIDEQYVDPSSVTITFPEKKRNLIYIYLESMENTFADTVSGGAFSENLIPNLTRLSLEHENFGGSSATLNGAVVLNNTTWTMGAMFAQSTALPLILPIDGNAMFSQDTFFPELVGIGDILEDAGYRNMLLMGPHAMFAGREIFYQNHGAYRMLDYDYSIVYEEIPEDYYVWWGYEDSKLFEFAKKHLLKAAKTDEPFNLTMLTVDTHYEDGYLCEDCEPLHEENPYADVYQCSDRKVGEFIKWVQRQKFYENTTIVLVGDHLTMDKDFCKNIAKDYERKVYVSVINSVFEAASKGDAVDAYEAFGYMENKADADEILSETEHGEHGFRYYSTMDMFPTTLAALGVEIEGNRLGLGTNLYSKKPTFLELYGEDALNTKLEQKSYLMERLASTIDTGRLDEQWSSLSDTKE